MNIGVIVLAAGSSSRLGKPKQLLSYQHKTLLDHTIDVAKNIAVDNLVVILGGNYEVIKENLNSSKVNTVYNPSWEIGISSSIRMGLLTLMESNKLLDGVILTVCDQPFLNSKLLTTMIEKAETTGKSIIASAYAETLGVPMLFSNIHFNDLITLDGKEGAKTLIKKYKDQVAFVPFEKGEIDIDTASDYDKLINTTGNI